MAGRLAEMSALVNKEQLMETLTSAYASPHVYLHKCMVHVLKLEGAVFKNVVERFSLLKADYFILNACCDLHENDYGIYILNLCDNITSMITLKQL